MKRLSCASAMLLLTTAGVLAQENDADIAKQLANPIASLIIVTIEFS